MDGQTSASAGRFVLVWGFMVSSKTGADLCGACPVGVRRCTGKWVCLSFEVGTPPNRWCSREPKGKSLCHFGGGPIPTKKTHTHTGSTMGPVFR